MNNLVDGLEESKDNLLKIEPKVDTEVVDTTNSIMGNKQNRYNLFSTIVIWSMTGFINYLMMYYSKYSEGSFYVNFSTQGIAESFGLIWIGLLSNKFETVGLLRFVTLLMISIVVLQMVIT